MINMKDFPRIKLLKLDNRKAVFYSLEGDAKTVDIKIYESYERGYYYYFSTGPNDWHPLSSRLWNAEYVPPRS